MAWLHFKIQSFKFKLFKNFNFFKTRNGSGRFKDQKVNRRWVEGSNAESQGLVFGIKWISNWDSNRLRFKLRRDRLGKDWDPNKWTANGTLGRCDSWNRLRLSNWEGINLPVTLKRESQWELSNWVLIWVTQKSAKVACKHSCKHSCMPSCIPNCIQVVQLETSAFIGRSLRGFASGFVNFQLKSNFSVSPKSKASALFISPIKERSVSSVCTQITSICFIHMLSLYEELIQKVYMKSLD